ncbi:HEXXH motif-containing putative peptide modification protein [Streptomyces sp. NPDC048717]|uniref:aKG-HExxH-type peptide beta-hydroxylase n=1 Tax=Streptomyces sp. NPDC048717 TaxID=3154928 RepID=UPI00342912EE
MTSGPLSDTALTRLAHTRPEPAGTQLLGAAVRARRRLLLKALRLRVDRGRDGPRSAPYTRFDASWALLERAERHHAGAVRAVVDYPATGTWLAAVLAAPEGPAFETLLAHWDTLAVAASLRARCPFDRELVTPGGVLALTGVGRLLTGAERTRVRFGGGRSVRIGPAGAPLPRAFPYALLVAAGPPPTRVRGTGPQWSPLRALPGGYAVLDDLDPYRVPPDGAGLSGRRAAGHAADAYPLWAAHWQGARTLLARTDPDRAREITRAVRTLVPMDPAGPTGPTGPTGHAGPMDPTAPARPFGATLAAAPGAVLTTPPANPRELAETLVHEVHHGKLAALHALAPLYRPGGQALHRVGWRADERPVSGVYQGAYAHLALTDLWRRAADGDGLPTAWRTLAGERFERYHDEVGDALSILLQSDQLTDSGREFAERMRRHHVSLGSTARGVP